MRAITLAAPVLGSLFLASVASAQTVEDARRHYLNAEFEEATTTFEAVLEKPSLDVPAAVECHVHLMVINLLLEEPDAAREHALYALSLDPSAAAPAGSPPAAEELLTEVRQQVTGPVRLSIDAVDTPEEGVEVSFIANLDSAPEGLFENVNLRCASGTATAEEDGTGPLVEVALVPQDEVFCRASATTDAGAALLRVQQSFPLGEVPLEGAAGDDEGTSPWVWVGVGAGVLAVAAAIVAVVLIVPSDQATLGAPMIERP